MIAKKASRFVFMGDECGLSQFHVFDIDLGVVKSTPRLNHEHLAERVLSEALESGSTVRQQIARMILPYIEQEELRGDELAKFTIALFGIGPLRHNLSMLMRDRCLGYGLSEIRRMLVIARFWKSSDRPELVGLLRG